MRMLTFLGVVLFWLTGSILVVIAYDAYYKNIAYTNLDKELNRLINFQEEFGSHELANELNKLNTSLTNLSHYTILVNKQNKPLGGNMVAWPDKTLGKSPELQDFEYALPSIYDDAKTRKMFGKVHVFSDESTLVVSNSREGFEAFHEFVTDLIILGTLIVVPSAFITVLLAGLSLQDQFDTFNRSIRRIMAGDLSERISIKHPASESIEMAENLNAMLDRLQLLMNDVKRVSDNIAHDLNTPLARLRNDVQSLLQDAEPKDQAKLEHILNESNTILSTFNALLQVAHIEAGRGTIEKHDFDLNTVVNDVVELYEPLAQDQGLELAFNGNLRCRAFCDRNLIFQAVANIIDNAIKYSDNDGEISISLKQGIHRSGTEVHNPSALKNLYEQHPDTEKSFIDETMFSTITVSDQGIGLPIESHAKIFQRLYREEKSRGLKPGSGLGLSIVMAVMRIHGGGIYVKSLSPGLQISLVIPSVEFNFEED